MRNTVKFLIGLTLFVAGCTREIASQSSVTLSVPSHKVGSLVAGPQLTRMVVNIRGSGIPGGMMTYIWDGKSSNGLTAPPQEISIEVPSGPDRLIQYLGIYEDSTSATQPMTFRYGRALKTLAPGPQTLEILAGVINATGGRSANVAGQYMLYDGIASGPGVFGPTTKVAMEALPDPNDPPMVVDYGEMFNGWMIGVAIEGVPTQYRLLDQDVLLSDLSYDVLNAVTTTTRMFHARVAPHFRHNSWDNSFEDQEGGDLFLGFFGPYAGSVTRKVHYSNGAFTIPGLYLTPSLSDPLYWMTAGEAEWIKHGEASGPTGTAYLDYLEFVPERLQNGLRDSSGFRGPFAHLDAISLPCGSSWGGMVSACMQDLNANSTEDLRLDFKYLPGVTISNGYSRGVQGVSAYAMNRLSCGGQNCHDMVQNPTGDGYRCSDMGQIPGIVFLGDVPSPQETAVFYDPSLSSGNYEIFLCPYRSSSSGREYFASGIGGGFYVSGGGGGAGAITIHGFTGGEDSQVDSYMVGAGAMSIHFNPEPGAVSYAVGVWDSSQTTSYCPEEIFNSSPATPTSCLSALISDGTQYKAVIRSFDASGSQLSQAESWFSRVTEVPYINIVNPLTCNTSSGGNLIIQANSYDYAVSMGIIEFDWVINYTGDSNGTNGVSNIPAGTALTMQTGITFNTGNPTTINHTFSLRHVSGYIANYTYPMPTTYNGLSACSP